MEKGKYNILNFKLYYIIQGVKMYLSEETMKNLSKIIIKCNLLNFIIRKKIILKFWKISP